MVIDKPITKTNLKEIANQRRGDLVKGVIDTEKRVLALGMELHTDGEQTLLEAGSRQDQLWGINLYPDLDREFDSVINMRPPKNRSRSVDDPEIRNIITEIVFELISNE